MANGLKEIADELNLSISTVSRALNNTGRVSAETRQPGNGYRKKI